MKISEQFTIRECMRLSFEESVFMDLQEDVDEDDHLRLKLQLHGAIYRPDSFVLMLRYCANLKAI